VSINPAQRDAYLTELRRLDGQIGAARALDELKPIFYRLEEISRACPGDAAIQSAIEVTSAAGLWPSGSGWWRCRARRSGRRRRSCRRGPGASGADADAGLLERFADGAAAGLPGARASTRPGGSASAGLQLETGRGRGRGGWGCRSPPRVSSPIRNAQKKLAEQRQAPGRFGQHGHPRDRARGRVDPGETGD
jgi:hypothetical protein